MPRTITGYIISIGWFCHYWDQHVLNLTSSFCNLHCFQLKTFPRHVPASIPHLISCKDILSWTLELILTCFICIYWFIPQLTIRLTSTKFGGAVGHWSSQIVSYCYKHSDDIVVIIWLLMMFHTIEIFTFSYELFMHYTMSHRSQRILVLNVNNRCQSKVKSCTSFPLTISPKHTYSV